MSDKQPKYVPAWRRWVGYLLKYGVPLLVTVLLCRMLFSGVDMAQMMDIIRQQCHFGWIWLALGISILSHVFRAMRWRIQLQALKVDVPLFTLVLSIFGTYAVNLVLPRLGEIWRTGYVSRRGDAPFATVFGSMVADRLADTLTVALLTLVTFLLATQELGTYLGENSDSYMTVLAIARSPWLWLAVAVVVAAVWWFLTRKTDIAIVNKLQHFVKGLWQGFAAVVRMPGKGRWLLLTVCIWGCYFSQLYVAFYAFDFTADIIARYGVLAALVTFVLSSISMGVPSNGGIGPWQWSVILALALYGLSKEPAAAFANLVMGTQTLCLIALGVFTFVCIALQKSQESRVKSREPRVKSKS